MKHAVRRSLCTTLSLGIAMSVSMSVFAQSELTTPEQKAGYSIGANIGSNLAGQGLAEDLDVDAIISGLRDSIAGGDLKMTIPEMEAAIQAFTVLQQEKMNAELVAQAQAGRDFLEQNGKQAGVTTTASGLQYSVLNNAPSSSAATPKETDTVSVHYTGTLIDGTVFDSSVERNEPATFPLNGVIPGWTEGLQLMKVGAKYRFFIPSELAYGEQGAPPVIPPNSPLIFDVELLSIEGQ
jgi:FKBP-type peptidyl-prolyl cis-trans isomerase FklB